MNNSPKEFINVITNKYGDNYKMLNFPDQSDKNRSNS